MHRRLFLRMLYPRHWLRHCCHENTICIKVRFLNWLLVLSEKNGGKTCDGEVLLLPHWKWHECPSPYSIIQISKSKLRFVQSQHETSIFPNSTMSVPSYKRRRVTKSHFSQHCAIIFRVKTFYSLHMVATNEFNDFRHVDVLNAFICGKTFQILQIVVVCCRHGINEVNVVRMLFINFGYVPNPFEKILSRKLFGLYILLNRKDLLLNQHHSSTRVSIIWTHRKTIRWKVP